MLMLKYRQDLLLTQSLSLSSPSLFVLSGMGGGGMSGGGMGGMKGGGMGMSKGPGMGGGG